MNYPNYKSMIMVFLFALIITIFNASTGNKSGTIVMGILSLCWLTIAIFSWYKRKRERR